MGMANLKNKFKLFCDPE